MNFEAENQNRTRNAAESEGEKKRRANFFSSISDTQLSFSSSRLSLRGAARVAARLV
jgi:hypothetical protein